MKVYVTSWRQGSKHGIYKTKSLTKFHNEIHISPHTQYARTIMIDNSVDCPFAPYTEIIAVTNKLNNQKKKVK